MVSHRFNILLYCEKTWLMLLKYRTFGEKKPDLQSPSHLSLGIITPQKAQPHSRFLHGLTGGGRILNISCVSWIFFCFGLAWLLLGMAGTLVGTMLPFSVEQYPPPNITAARACAYFIYRVFSRRSVFAPLSRS